MSSSHQNSGQPSTGQSGVDDPPSNISQDDEDTMPLPDINQQGRNTRDMATQTNEEGNVLSHLERAALLLERAENILQRLENDDDSTPSEDEINSNADEEAIVENLALLDTLQYPCPICEDAQFDRALSCGHVMCHECLTRIRNCPFCRNKDFFVVSLYLP